MYGWHVSTDLTVTEGAGSVSIPLGSVKGIISDTESPSIALQVLGEAVGMHQYMH